MSQGTRQQTRKGKKNQTKLPGPTREPSFLKPPGPTREPSFITKHEKSFLDGTEWTSVYKHNRAQSIAGWSKTSKPTREHSLISEYVGISKPKRQKSKLLPTI